MHKFGVSLTALAVIGVSACAERTVNPAIIPKPPPPNAAPKPQPNKVEAMRQTETTARDIRGNSATQSRVVIPSARIKPGQSPQPQPPQASQQPLETRISPDPLKVAVLPTSPETAEPNFPVAALMPPPPEPAEPTFPSVAPAVELPPAPDRAAPILPEVAREAAMPPPPEPAEPSFAVAAQMPPPPEPAEPSLPLQAEIIAESSFSVPLPDLPSYLSLQPRFDWVDTVGAIDIPRGPVPRTSEASPERQVPSLIRSPWPLSIETP